MSDDLDGLQRLASRPTVEAEQQILYQKRVQQLREKIARFKANGNGASALAAFAPTQRVVLEEVFNAIYVAHGDLGKAHHLVEHVLKRLTKAMRNQQRKKQS